MIETLAESDAAIHAADNWPVKTNRGAWVIHKDRPIFQDNGPAERLRQEPECTVP